jgi:hypothetical protein
MQILNAILHSDVAHEDVIRHIAGEKKNNYCSSFNFEEIQN